MRPFTDRPPRRHPRRPGIVRSLLALLRPFDGERFTLRERMSPDDWKRLACDRGAKLAQQEREAADMAIEIRTLRRAVALADEGKRLAEAGMRHADGERDEARKAAAAWEVQARDLRDRLVEEQKRAVKAAVAAGAKTREEALAMKAEGAAWREERAGMVRQRQDLIGLWQAHVGTHRPCLCRWCDLGRILGLLPAADPDPRSAGPGGADLLAGGPAEDMFACADRLHREGYEAGKAGQPCAPPARLIPVERVIWEQGHAIGAAHAVPPRPPAAPEVQVRTVVLDRTPPFVPPPAPEVRPPHDRVPDMSRRPAPAPSDDPVDVAERVVESRLRGEGVAS